MASTEYPRQVTRNHLMHDREMLMRKSSIFAGALYIVLLVLQSGQVLSVNLKIVNGSLLSVLSLIYSFSFGYRALAVTVLLNTATILAMQLFALTTGDTSFASVQAYLVFNMVGAALAARLTEKDQQQRQRLEWLSMVDGLTEVYNHRYFRIRLDEEVARMQRSGKTLGLIMVDVDNFKQYNDRFGHQAGDELLKSTARLFKVETRQQDVVCRYGGDEFAILLPDTDLAEVSKVARRISQAITKTGLPKGTAGIKLTLSMGISAYPKPAESSDELVTQADSALYSAKHQGKDCVQLYQAELPASGPMDEGGLYGPAGGSPRVERRFHGYSERVSTYAAAVGIVLGVAPERINLPLFAALLDDIGKIELPELAYGEKGAGS